MEFLAFAFAFVAVLVGAVVQGAVGFGLALVLAGFLSVLFDRLALAAMLQGLVG